MVIDFRNGISHVVADDGFVLSLSDSENRVWFSEGFFTDEKKESDFIEIKNNVNYEE